MTREPSHCEPLRPSGRIGEGKLAATATGNITPVIDLIFDSGTLASLRREVRACAIQSGFPEDRVTDMVLVVHELAANAIVHGGGAGRLRLWKLARTLQCQFDDGDHMRSPDEAGRSRTESISPRGAPGSSSLNSLPREAGHGLSVVWRLADQAQELSGPHGTRVMIAFDLPG